MRNKGIIAAVIIAVIAIITNPSRKDHGVELWRASGGECGILVIEESTEYHNFILFSAGALADWRSFGIFGQIFTSQVGKRNCPRGLKITRPSTYGEPEY